MSAALEIVCPRSCGARFVRQPLAGATILHECSRTRAGVPFKAKTQRAEIEVVVGGADAGREAGSTVRSPDRPREEEEPMSETKTLDELLPAALKPKPEKTLAAIVDAVNGDTAPLDESGAPTGVEALEEVPDAPSGDVEPEPKAEEAMPTKTATKKAPAKNPAAKKSAPAATSIAKFGEGAKVKIVSAGWSVRGWMVGETGTVLAVGRARVSVKFSKTATREKLGSKVGEDGGFGVRPECLSIVK